MTLAEQFPDISMVIREKRKLNLKYNEALFFNNIHGHFISAEQKSYDKKFRVFHVKLIGMISFLVVSLFLLILNGQAIWKWAASLIN
jgi:hypothetical protein